MNESKRSSVGVVLFLVLLIIVLFFVFNSSDENTEIPLEENDQDIVNIDLSLGEENGEALPQ